MSDPTTAGARRLLAGVRRFHERLDPDLRAELRRLATEGQSPAALWISCSDSRVVPSLIADAGPGELFSVRNVGNLVPLHGSEASSVGAAIQFCLDVLAIDTIAVCGHSQCAACKALGAGGASGQLERWLAHGRPSIARAGGQDGVALIQANVVQQLEHVRSYPGVRAAEEDGRLALVGLYFDIERARVSLLDGATGMFAPLGDDDQLALAMR